MKKTKQKKKTDRFLSFQRIVITRYISLFVQPHWYRRGKRQREREREKRSVHLGRKLWPTLPVPRYNVISCWLHSRRKRRKKKKECQQQQKKTCTTHERERERWWRHSWPIFSASGEEQVLLFSGMWINFLPLRFYLHSKKKKRRKRRRRRRRRNLLPLTYAASRNPFKRISLSIQSFITPLSLPLKERGIGGLIGHKKFFLSFLFVYISHNKRSN